MISAFGARAELLAERLGEHAAVIADMTMLEQAHLEAIRRRERGEAFYAMVLYEEPRAQTTLAYAWQVLTQIEGIDERRLALRQLGEGKLLLGKQPARDLWSAPVARLKSVNEFLSLGNAVFVRSYAEANRLNALGARPRTIEPVLSAPKIPAVAPRVGAPPGVVIWAPHRAPAFVAWYAFALAEFFGTVTCVTAGDAGGLGLPARFVAAEDPALAEILSGAQCVVCTDPDDPGPAAAFARAGFGVAAPYASGAHEFARDVAEFDFAHPREVEIAVKIAIGRPASLRSLPQPPAAPAG